MSRAIACLVALAVQCPCPGAAQPRVAVRAETRIELRVQPADEGVHVSGVLRDDRGEPLAERAVQLSLSAIGSSEARQPVTTGDNGGFAHLFMITATSYRISARFEGDASYRGETVAQDIDLERAHVRLGLARADGQPLDRIDLDEPEHEVRVAARSEAGDANLAVELTDELGEVLASGQTDADGSVTLRMPSAPLGEPASGRLVVRTPGDATRSAAQVEMPVVRFRRTVLHLETSVDTLAPGASVVVAGRLSTSTGPLPRRAVGLFDGDRHLTTVLTDDEGRFQRELTPESDESMLLEARFDSDAPWRPSAVSPSVTVQVMAAPTPGWGWLLVPIALCLAALIGLWRRNRRAAPTIASSSPGAQPGIELGTALRRLADQRDVVGLVSDAHDADPIAGARVALGGPAGALEATSDTDGRFRFDEVPDGDWELRVDAEGYELRVGTIRLPHRGGASALRVRLRSLRHAVMQEYRPLAQALAPEPRWWAFWTPRELEPHASGAVREEIATLTRRIEHAAYGAAVPARDEVREIGREAGRLARRGVDGTDVLSDEG